MKERDNKIYTKIKSFKLVEDDQNWEVHFYDQENNKYIYRTLKDRTPKIRTQLKRIDLSDILENFKLKAFVKEVVNEQKGYCDFLIKFPKLISEQEGGS